MAAAHELLKRTLPPPAAGDRCSSQCKGPSFVPGHRPAASLLPRGPVGRQLLARSATAGDRAHRPRRSTTAILEENRPGGLNTLFGRLRRAFSYTRHTSASANNRSRSLLANASTPSSEQPLPSAQHAQRCSTARGYARQAADKYRASAGPAGTAPLTAHVPAPALCCRFGQASAVVKSEPLPDKDHPSSFFLETRAPFWPPARPPPFPRRARPASAGGPLEDLAQTPRDDHGRILGRSRLQELTWHTPFTVTLDDTHGFSRSIAGFQPLTAPERLLQAAWNVAPHEARNNTTSVHFRGRTPGDGAAASLLTSSLPTVASLPLRQRLSMAQCRPTLSTPLIIYI